MKKRPNLLNLLPLFKSKISFSLTETQYEQMTGANLPQNKKYLEKQSALSKFADNQGFVVSVKERIVICKKKKEDTNYVG